MPVPSKRRLVDAFGEEAGAKLRDLLTGRLKPDTLPSVQDWLKQSYSRPSDDELTLCAANALLDGYGVEVINGRWVDHYHQTIQAAYVNNGDTYAPTLLLDHETQRFLLTSWGDWVERNERRRELQ